MKCPVLFLELQNVSYGDIASHESESPSSFFRLRFLLLRSSTPSSRAPTDTGTLSLRPLNCSAKFACDATELSVILFELGERRFARVIALDATRIDTEQRIPPDAERRLTFEMCQFLSLVLHLDGASSESDGRVRKKRSIKQCAFNSCGAFIFHQSG